MNNDVMLWQWKSLANINWCIKQNKKMINRVFIHMAWRLQYYDFNAISIYIFLCTII